MGRCRRPPRNDNCTSTFLPGLPRIIMRGLAQGVECRTLDRGSMCGNVLAARRLKYTSSGVLPLKAMCGLYELYQCRQSESSFSKSSLFTGTIIRRVHSSFIERCNRSTTAIEPCAPIAPNLGLMFRSLHQLRVSLQ